MWSNHEAEAEAEAEADQALTFWKDEAETLAISKQDADAKAQVLPRYCLVMCQRGWGLQQTGKR